MKCAPAVALVAALALLQGCTLFGKKYRPVDVGEDAPAVSDVLAQVQAAIDATGENPAWGEMPGYKEHDQVCTDGQDKSKADRAKACNDKTEEARALCAKTSGATAVALCEDYLRGAAAICAAPLTKPDSCDAAKLLAPVKIKSAKFRFIAKLWLFPAVESMRRMVARTARCFRAWPAACGQMAKLCLRMRPIFG